MKLKKSSLVYLTILITMLGASTVLAVSQGSEIKANVAWDPKTYTWNGTPPDPWNAEIWLTRGHKRHEIDTATIRLEGTYSPSATPYAAVHGPRLIVPFSGSDVKAALDANLPYHMDILIPRRYRIPLEITGNLKSEYGGTSFRGTGYIHLTIPENLGS